MTSSLEFEGARLHRRALRLEYATIAWNVGEAFLTIALGSIAGSVALIGFGAVSVVEIFASSVVVWHLRGADTATPTATGIALRSIAAAFLLISLALFVVAGNDIASGRRADESPLGIAFLAVTAVVMFALAFAKRRIAKVLDSEPLGSEATVTFLDGVLSVGTLLGLALNAYVGWWWADPVAGMLVAMAAANESRETLAEARSISAGEL